MINFFSKSKKNEEPKSFIRFEKDENNIISLYFNERQANKTAGEYQRDYKNVFELGKFAHFNAKAITNTIYEWAVEDHDFVETGDTLLVIRRDINDITKNMYQEVLLLPQIISNETGFVEIAKKEKTTIVNNELICKIYPTPVFNNSNGPGNEVFYGKFDRYEIPKQIRNLNLNADKYLFLTKWIVNNGDTISKGDEIAIVSGGDFKNYFFHTRLKLKLQA